MPAEFDITASLKGALGETLLTEHKTAIREYFADWYTADLEANNPEWIPDTAYRTSFDIDGNIVRMRRPFNGDFATWYPDALYSLRFESVRRDSASFEAYTVEYPIEVKTGQSSELSDNQRAVMATIEQQEIPVFPLRIRVDVADLPDSFSIVPNRIQHIGDTPLPNYSTDSTRSPPSETKQEVETRSLSSFKTTDGEQ
ncbi:hypothetical protein [Natronococcus wangiae]|uniref:hypothetical protein n=1 Tax=Natronococcus wangiae TaxID=3068275 RepID=UPI00273D03D3|nr:hypothetical protein [Natronococcus sp. AD5]